VDRRAECSLSHDRRQTELAVVLLVIAVVAELRYAELKGAGRQNCCSGSELSSWIGVVNDVIKAAVEVSPTSGWRSLGVGGGWSVSWCQVVGEAAFVLSVVLECG
jgi:hypothetical protein